MKPEDKDALILNKALSYANGYRELGMHKEALDELSQLPANLATEIRALQMKLSVLFEAKNWKAAESAAKEIALRKPDDPGNVVNLAYATRRAKSIQDAKAILLGAVDQFPNAAIIHYNLGCYACLDKDYETAKARLATSISLDPSFLNTAKSDEDLTALFEWLENLEIA